MEKQKNSECWYKDVCDDDCFMCNTYLQLKWQMDNSGLPAVLQRPIELYITDDNKCDKQMYKRLADIRKNIVDFVDGGNSLYICGYAGNGKTSWAIKLLQSYLHHKAPGNYERLQGMFVSVTDLLLRLKDFNNPVPKEYKDNLERVPLVIWDDIGITGMSQYDYTQIYTMINNRYLAGKSNIYTSNLVERMSLEDIVGDRLASRIYGLSEIIELKGRDMR
jgi:DNA replication protein DnaC